MSAFSRRWFLRGATASVALPFLPSLTRAQDGDVPKRFIAIYAPGGVVQGGSFHTTDHWRAGATFERLDDPSHILHELRDFKADLIQLQNIRRESFYYGTQTLGLAGAIGHWGEHPNYLTGSSLKPSGSDTSWREVLVDDASIDQKIARLTGHRPLNLGLAPRTGPSTLHSLSWLSSADADPWISDPLEVFTRIFGPAEARADIARFQHRLLLRRSVLDGVSDERARLERTLGTADRRHLDAYFTTLRETEQRIAESRELSCLVPDEASFVPATLFDRARILTDLALLALECDHTRVITLTTWGAGGGTGGQVAGSYIEGLSEPIRDYHYFTHFATAADGIDAPRLANFMTSSKWSAGAFARLVRGLADRTDADGESMLHNSLVMYGSGIGDAAHHQYQDIARVFAGQAGGSVRTGRILRPSESQVPAENLLPEILDLFGYRDASGAPQTVVGLSNDIISLR